MVCKKIFIVLSLAILISGCYSFKGISIPPTIATFYVDQFQNSAGNAPPDVGQRFSEELKDIVIRNSRLNYEENIPDIEFTGTITTYSVQSVAPERRDNADGGSEFGSSLNRLNISVKVDYINNMDDEDNWSQVFSFFEDFESTQNLSDVQDELIEKIFDQITTDIFNKAFTNW